MSAPQWSVDKWHGQYTASVVAALMLDHGMPQHEAYRALRRDSAEFLLGSGLPAGDVATLIARIVNGRHVTP